MIQYESILGVWEYNFWLWFLQSEQVLTADSKSNVIIFWSCMSQSWAYQNTVFGSGSWLWIYWDSVQSDSLTNFLQYSKKLHLFQKYTIISRKKRCSFFCSFSQKTTPFSSFQIILWLLFKIEKKTKFWALIPFLKFFFTKTAILCFYTSISVFSLSKKINFTL